MSFSEGAFSGDVCYHSAHTVHVDFINLLSRMNLNQIVICILYRVHGSKVMQWSTQIPYCVEYQFSMCWKKFYMNTSTSCNFIIWYEHTSENMIRTFSFVKRKKNINGNISKRQTELRKRQGKLYRRSPFGEGPS